MIVYDPRINKEVESDNPSLIAGKFIEEIAIRNNYTTEGEFWRNVICNANYLDEKLTIEESLSDAK